MDTYSIVFLALAVFFFLVLLCHKLIAVNRLGAARTSVQSVDDCDDQASSHRCDRVWDVPFGP
ncbi:hypothetical protein, partial [Bradyrhizobium sp.]|uniref:hypothetical protein n=1 Tax=Bradyrhizobium sp. TaxID=376 RepID=UPI003BB1DBFC